MRFILATTFVLLVSISAYSHHSRTYFQLDVEARVTGTVTQVKWRNPHVRYVLTRVNKQGQMETWSHGQDIFDMFGRTRVNTDRLKNIAVIGVRTYGWTFANRGMEPPGPAPHVRLMSPSGETWEFNELDESNLVKGDAVQFCHVVTQGRNIQDVNLEVRGEPAQKWMAIAQCFAGPPEDPPAPGSRTIKF